MVAVFACAIAFNAITNSNKTALSAVTLANIEALTRGEIGVDAICNVSPWPACVYCGLDYGEILWGVC